MGKIVAFLGELESALQIYQDAISRYSNDGMLATTLFYAGNSDVFAVHALALSRRVHAGDAPAPPRRMSPDDQNIRDAIAHEWKGRAPFSIEPISTPNDAHQQRAESDYRDLVNHIALLAQAQNQSIGFDWSTTDLNHNLEILRRCRSLLNIQ